MTAILWNSNGEAEILLGGKIFTYFGLRRVDWEQVVKYCAKKDKRLYQFLKQFSKRHMVNK